MRNSQTMASLATGSFRRVLVVSGCLAALLWVSSGTTFAIEPSRQFVEGLRERGHHEMVLEYLKDLPKNPLAPPDFVKTSAYEEAATYIDWAGKTRDFKEQESRLAKGETKLKEFQNANKRHPLVSSAEMQIGNIALHRARMKKLQAEAKQKTEEEKKALLDEAVKLYREAYTKFAAAELKFKTERDKIPKTDKKPASREMRNTLRNGMLHSGVSAANSLYELAKSQEKGSDAQKKTLKEASEVYDKLFLKYQRYLLGLRYRLQYARCLHETVEKDNVELSLMVYSEYEGMPDGSSAVRELKALALAFQIAALVPPATKKFDLPVKLDQAIKMGEQWLRKANTAARKTDEYLSLTIELASAYEAAADGTKDPVKKRGFVREAVKLAKTVERLPTAHRVRAKEILKRLEGEPQGDLPEPTTYVAALSRANAARGEWQTAKDSLAEALKSMNKQAEAEFTKLADEKLKESFKYYNMAIRLADEKTTEEDISKIRYILCYLYWAEEQYFRAAALGEYIAQMHANTDSAQKSALLAMEAYKRLYAAVEEGENNAFELNRLTTMAEMVSKLWPDTKAAESALLTLFNMAIRKAYERDLPLGESGKRLDKSAVILDKIPGGTAQAGVASIQVGQGYWRQYLLSLQEPEAERPAEEQLEALAAKAKTYLKNGVDYSKGGEVDSTVARAALSLAKILVDDSELNKATELLEDKHHGPLTLAEGKHEATKDSKGDTKAFAIDAYKTALRAYIGSTPQRVDDAKKMLDKLKTTIGRDRKARETLDREMINIGIRLKKQLDNESRKGNDDRVQAIAKGIQVFLGEIGKQNDEYNTLSWVASTFYNLGESFRDAAKEKKTGKEALRKKSQEYYAEADKVYRRIFETIEADPEWGPESRLGLDVRYANLLLRLNDYESATAILINILTDKPNMLSIQVEAAKAYQQWGLEYGKADSKNMDKMLNRALAGYKRHPDDKNKRVVWGWNRLMKLTARDPKFRLYFHEACYNMAYCLYKQSQIEKGSDRKKKLELAEKVVTIAYGADEKLGGSLLYRKYDALLKSVQKGLGNSTAGITALKGKAT